MKKSFSIVFFLLIVACSAVKAANLTGTSTPVYQNAHYVFRNFNNATGYVRLNNGFTILAGQSAALDTFITVSGAIDLRTTGSIDLRSDLYLASNITFSTGGYINGRTNTIHLGDDITLPTNSIFQIVSDTIIDGRNKNALIFQPHAQLLLASNVSLTLKNMTIKNTRNSPNIPILRCFDQKGDITLDNVTLELVDDFSFRTGRLFFNNDVRFTGTSRFIYQSWMQSYVMPQSLLTFDPGMTLYYHPSSTNQDLIQLVDQSSTLFIRGSISTLQTTHTGMRLTKGNLWFDNKVTLSTRAATAMDVVTQTTTFNYGSVVNSVAWSPDRRYLAVSGTVPNGGNEVHVYSFSGGLLTLLSSLDFGGNCLRIKWSPDGRYLAAVGGTTDNFKVYSFDGTTLAQVAALSLGAATNNTQGLDWSRDGNYIAVGPINPTSGNEIQIFRFTGVTVVSTPVATIDLGATAGTVAGGMSWNPLGTTLAIGANSIVTGGNEIRIYTFNGSSLTLKTSVNYGASNGVNSIEFDPSGLHVAVGGQSPTSGNELQIYRYNGSTLLLVASVDYGTAINEVRWDPTGRYLAVGGTTPTNGNELQIYRFDGAALTLIFSQDYGTAINGLSWSPDGATFAIGGQTATASHNEIEVYSIAYRFDTLPQALTNGLVLGNGTLGAAFDLQTIIFGGARVELFGRLLYNPFS